MNKTMKGILVFLTALLLFVCSGVSIAQNPDELIKFAVIALDQNSTTRTSFEDQLVARLVSENYDAVVSYDLVPNINDLSLDDAQTKLLNEGITAVLLFGLIDAGENASIETAQEYLNPQSYSRIQDFVINYREQGFDSQVVVHVAGYLLQDENSLGFWQGVLWLDDTVESEQEGIEKLVDLVSYNLNQSRSLLRKRLGLKPL